jgi:hypothetical protein
MVAHFIREKPVACWSLPIFMVGILPPCFDSFMALNTETVAHQLRSSTRKHLKSSFLLSLGVTRGLYR